MMKRVIMVTVISLSCLCMPALADTPKKGGPEVINLKMGIMVLPFQHRQHQIKLNNECFHCHSKNSPGKIDGWGQDAAHKICISCHDLEGKGPVECKQCHDK